MALFAVRGELGLEPLDLDTEGERARAEQSRERGLQLYFQPCVLPIERNERHGRRPPRRNCFDCLHSVPLLVFLRQELCQVEIRCGIGRPAHAPFREVNAHLRRSFPPLATMHR